MTTCRFHHLRWLNCWSACIVQIYTTMTKYSFFACVAWSCLPRVLWCPNYWWAAWLASYCKYGRIVNWWKVGNYPSVQVLNACCHIVFLRLSINLWFPNIWAITIRALTISWTIAIFLLKPLGHLQLGALDKAIK
jgi:hypothetical protein